MYFMLLPLLLSLFTGSLYSARREPVNLLQVVEKGDIAGVKNLLKRFPLKIGTKDLHGQTALHIAAAIGFVEIILILHRYDTRLNEATYKFKQTALHYAAANSQTEATRTLVALGANKNAKDWMSYTPLDWARIKDHRDAARVLFEEGAASTRPTKKTVRFDLAKNIYHDIDPSI